MMARKAEKKGNLSGLAKGKGENVVLPPNIGLWRVDPSPSVARDDKAAKIDQYTAVSQKKFSRLPDMVACYGLRMVMEGTPCRSTALCAEPAKGDKPDYFEGIAIMEATSSVFEKVQGQLLAISGHPSLIVNRPSGDYGFAPVDYFVDIFPCDVKTVQPETFFQQKQLKAFIKAKYQDPKLTPEGFASADKTINKKVLSASLKQDRNFILTSHKFAPEAEAKDLDVILAEHISDGVNGGVASVIDRLQRSFHMGEPYEETQCIPYVVVDTGFLTNKQRERFWRKIDANLKANKMTDLEHLIIEVCTCCDFDEYFRDRSVCKT